MLGSHPDAPDGRRCALFSAALVTVPLLVAQVAGPAAGRPDEEAAVEVFAVLFAVLAVICIIYVVWNTLLAWIASKIMAFQTATLGRALKFSILSSVAGCCMTLLWFAVMLGIMGLTFRAIIDPETASLALAETAHLIAALAFLALWWLITVMLAGWTYRTGIIRAAIFTVVLLIVHVAVGVIFRALGCVSTGPPPT